MEVVEVLKKLRQVLLTVLPTVIYAHLDSDNEQNAEPPFIIYQEISKRPPSYGDDKPVYYLRTIQITLLKTGQHIKQYHNFYVVIVKNVIQ